MFVLGADVYGAENVWSDSINSWLNHDEIDKRISEWDRQ